MLLFVNMAILQGTIRIHEIYENSPAAKSGVLRPGDQILRLNETQMTGLTHEAAVDLLRSSQDKVYKKIYWNFSITK
jgi:C-terminal processing protease CtpA/Prc